ncbi:MAG: polysaccharide biosynthesis protein [Lachnospiraceae bacterium]|nr:polysaccharide biosynthesis protein [Lachnospiraceae bacterium]
MTERNRRSDNFIMQAGILATAGIISRIIGLLYRSPLTEVIGEVGMGYYQAAYSFYSIVLLISSYSIPAAISKVIAEKLGRREYRNAHRVFLCAMGYVLVVGLVASLFLYFGAGLFVKPEAIGVLRVFAPTIFIYGILGVLRGYFQAHKTMVQTSCSQVLEQIANAVVSILAAYLLIKSAMGTMEIPMDEAGQVTRASYGAMGSALGTGAGVLVALLFMAGIYALNKGVIHRRIARDKHTEVDSYGDILRTITAVVTPFILSTAVYNLSTSLNTALYTKLLPAIKEIEGMTIDYNWGIFSGLALTISNIPIAFASAMASAMLPSVAQTVAAERSEELQGKISMAVKTIMIISIPCGVGLFVLAKPLVFLLFPRSDAVVTLAGKLLMALAVSVIFYALSTLSNTVLQGLGKVNVPIINAGVALVVQTVVAVLLLAFTGADIYAIAIANVVYSGAMCVLNQWSLYKAIGYKQEWIHSFLLPALAAVFMGGSAYVVYEGLYLLTASMRISVIPAVIVAVAVYFVALIKLRGLTEEEMRKMPKGHMLVKLAKKCRLL